MPPPSGFGEIMTAHIENACATPWFLGDDGLEVRDGPFDSVFGRLVSMEEGFLDIASLVLFDGIK